MTPDRLPVASRWFQVAQVDDGLSVVTEPHVHEFLRANIWHLRGSRRDLVVDAAWESSPSSRKSRSSSSGTPPSW